MQECSLHPRLRTGLINYSIVTGYMRLITSKSHGSGYWPFMMERKSTLTAPLSIIISTGSKYLSRKIHSLKIYKIDSETNKKHYSRLLAYKVNHS